MKSNDIINGSLVFNLYNCLKLYDTQFLSKATIQSTAAEGNPSCETTRYHSTFLFTLATQFSFFFGMLEINTEVGHVIKWIHCYAFTELFLCKHD